MMPIDNAVARIVDELEGPFARVKAVAELATANELLELANYYNWDDGMEVPTAIIDHPACDLGLALHMFELAEGVFYLAEVRDWKHQEDWVEFCRTLSGRVLGHYYAIGTIPFESALTAVQRLKLTRSGVPSVFFTTIELPPARNN